MRDKDKDLDRLVSKIKSPYNRIFSQQRRVVRYIVIVKNQFSEFMYVMGKQGVEVGYKGKGNLLHLIVDNQGTPMLMERSPANGDERIFARKMAKECVKKHNIKFGVLQADKGYDDQKIRGLVQNILGADSDIPRRRNSRAKSTIGELIEKKGLLDETYKDNNR